MNELAKKLNTQIEGTAPFNLLSNYGKRFYFPSQGIVAQAGEAKAKAHLYNATVGMACYNKKPIILPQIKNVLTGLTEDEAVSYAPTPGVSALRDLWKKEIYRKNPDLKEAPISRPIVVPGLTAGISQVAELFTEKGINLVAPDMFWGNYRLIFEGKREANLILYPFFTKEKGFNLKGYKETLLKSAQDKKIRTILNFPNNPTGYSPSNQEAEAIEQLFLELAQDNYEILVITDDAYFGLFYEEETYKQSLFAKLANLHKNILAVKVDGATKEHFVWGFRLGFVTFGCKDYNETQYNSLVQKISGSLRATVSNSSRPAQSIMAKALADSTYEANRKDFDKKLKDRYNKVKEILKKRTTGKILDPISFNSGYFMTFKVNGNAEALRKKLLEEEGIGTIAIQGTYLRVAFSAVDLEAIEPLYNKIFKTADSL